MQIVMSSQKKRHSLVCLFSFHFPSFLAVVIALPICARKRTFIPYAPAKVLTPLILLLTHTLLCAFLLFLSFIIFIIPIINFFVRNVYDGGGAGFLSIFPLLAIFYMSSLL